MAITTRAGKGSALTHAEMDANLGYLVPPGAVMAFAMNAAPAGWMECNGSAISRTLYADLFAAIGTTFGAGDGSSTFNLPNLRGEFIRGWDNGRGVDAGRTFGSTQADELKSHTHSFSPNPVTGRGGAFTAGPGSQPLSGETPSIGATGGAETRPRNIAMMYCIKA